MNEATKASVYQPHLRSESCKVVKLPQEEKLEQRTQFSSFEPALMERLTSCAFKEGGVAYVSSDYTQVKPFSPELSGQNLLRIIAFGPWPLAGAEAEGRRMLLPTHLPKTLRSRPFRSEPAELDARQR